MSLVGGHSYVVRITDWQTEAGHGFIIQYKVSFAMMDILLIYV